MAQKRNRNPYALGSADYWRAREEDNRIKAQMDDYTRSLELRGIYQDMYKRADTEIQAYYQKYAEENGITYAEAMKRSSKLDIEAYEAKAKRIVADKDFSPEANAEMRLYNMTMRVNRLELLKANIGLELVDGFYGMDKYFDAELRGVAYGEHQRLAGIMGETVNGNAKNARVLPTSSHKNIGFKVKEVEGVAVEPFYHATFSNRIWTHYTELKNELDILLARALVNGESSLKLAEELQEKFDVSQGQAQRLMVTEATRTRIEVQKMFYEENGNDRYEVLALGQSPCKACSELAERSQKEHGLPVKKMTPGVNAPPMHPWCRCSTAPYVDMDDYEQWLNALNSGLTTEQYEALSDAEKRAFHPDAMGGLPKGMVGGVVNGKDIAGTWQRRPDEYEFEIDDVLAAQGFDGLPRVVGEDEFDEAVKKSKFVAQRTYSAESQEVLDAYREELYHGKWYVDCSTGGAGYGQGMYCAADYTGALSDGIKAEMEGYQRLGMGRLGMMSSSDLQAITENQKQAANEVLRKYKAGEMGRDEGVELYRKISNMQPSEYLSSYMKDSEIKGARSYVETFTLDPSAKVISWRDINDIRMGNLDINYRTKEIERLINAQELTKDEETFVRFNLNTGASSWEETNKAASKLSPSRIDELVEKTSEIGEEASRLYNDEHARRIEMARVYQEKYNDPGSLAAALGYDAINAEGHGQSGSYTVILNRTKVIFKQP